MGEQSMIKFKEGWELKSEGWELKSEGWNGFKENKFNGTKKTNRF